jgi:thioredoxin reductase
MNTTHTDIIIIEQGYLALAAVICLAKTKSYVILEARAELGGT